MGIRLLVFIKNLKKNVVYLDSYADIMDLIFTYYTTLLKMLEYN